MARRRDVPPVPTGIKWAAFLGWLIAPVVAAWATAAAFDIGVLWTGPVWFGYAVVYMAVYFSWVSRRSRRLSALRSADGTSADPRRG